MVVNSQRIMTRARGVFRDQGKKPLPGDWVEVRYNDEDMTGYIESIEDRKNQLLRPPVANVDQCVIVASVSEPDFNAWTVDRTLLQVESQHIHTAVLITKADVDYEMALAIKGVYENIYPTFLLGFGLNDDLEVFLDFISHKITALMGVSGAGKSTLINYVSHHDLETGEVSDKTKRGKHTTRHVELYEIDSNSFIFDTPGFSSLDIHRYIEDEREIADGFPEFFEPSKRCRFNSCLHDKEPGCKVKELVLDNKIAKSRYDNYISFLNEFREDRRY